MDVLSYDIWTDKEMVEKFEFTLDELTENELLKVREFSRMFLPLHGEKKIHFVKGKAIIYPPCVQYHEMACIRTAGFKFNKISIKDYQLIIALVKNDLEIDLTKRYR